MKFYIKHKQIKKTIDGTMIMINSDGNVRKEKKKKNKKKK